MKYPLLQIIMRSRAVLIIVSLVIILISVVSFGTSCAPGASRSQEASWELSRFGLFDNPELAGREGRMVDGSFVPNETTINIERGKPLYIKAIISNIGGERGTYEWDVYVDDAPFYHNTTGNIDPDPARSGNYQIGQYAGCPDTKLSYPTIASTTLGVHEVRIGNVTLHFTVIAPQTGQNPSGLTAATSTTTTNPTTGTPDTSVPSTPATPVTPTTPGAVTTPTTIPTTPTPPPPTIDFSKWFSEAYATMSDEDYYLPVWNISDDNKSVTENTNCQPSLFYSDFLTMNTRIHVKIKPLSKPGDDDDYIGFVLGFQPGDTKNKQADYLLIDWKNSIPGESLNKDFNSPGSGGSAKVGLAVSRVTGIPTSDEFWQHIDDPQGSPQGEGLTELAPRSVNFGNTGWVFDKEYDFSFEFSQTTLKIYVDGTLEMQISGNFKDGRLAFYNFSQEGVTYKVTQ